MSITVEVISYKGQSPVERLAVTFDQQGGTLGRSPENHVVLVDPQKLISRTHAVIRYENGGYYLHDTSTTGTFIYTKNVRVHQEKIQLDNGDKIRMGDYDLIVYLPGAVTNHAGETAGFCPEPAPQAVANSYQTRPENGDKTLLRPAREVPTMADIPALVPDLSPDSHGAALLHDQHSVAPELGPCTSASTSPDAIQAQENRQQAYNALLKVFLEAAGIQDIGRFPHEDIPAIMRTAGALFREMIDGLGTILRGRAAAKSHLRTAVTTIQAVQNNPLKFAAADDLLTLLLTSRHPGYLTGVEAVRAGCTDLIQHELAMTAGVQAAILALLARVAPQHVVPPDATSSPLPRRTKSKAQCWDIYCQAYKQVVAEAEDFFGLEAFGQAYEEQLGKLRSQDYKSAERWF